jgi:hypothetical protein
MRFSRPLLIALLALLSACKSSPKKEAPSVRADRLAQALAQGTAVLPPAPGVSAASSLVALWPDWNTLPRMEFAQRLQQELASDQRWKLSQADLGLLASHLPRQDESSLRALWILARLSDPLATELCLAHLERRLGPRPEAPLAAVVDWTAAAALASMQALANQASRLESLAFGARPHPDVDVRVECGIRAFELGKPRATEFLLATLRQGTRLSARGTTFPANADLSRCQARAAQALMRACGLQGELSPLDPIETRENWVRTLEAALKSPTTAAP